MFNNFNIGEKVTQSKYIAFFFIALFPILSECIFAQYNDLWIPDTLSGTNFNLIIKDTTAQLRPGNKTNTSAVNNSQFWGPTLFMNKGDVVHMNVQNNLMDTTTLHWHGLHLPAVMDGGPHQTIPPGTSWQPTWKVTNNASTFWYHPHLHMMTMEHVARGIGGFIIIRDPLESALALPRTYGVDDIPVAFTSRKYSSNNELDITSGVYGDYQLANGTSNAQINLPQQFIRLRILNAEVERGYNLGFSDNRTFYVIGNDGGLLNAPVSVTRVKLMVGERIEILVDLSKDNIGSSIDLKAYNANQTFGFPGGEPAQSGQFGSLLNNKDFVLLHINIKATTLNAITSLPSKLANNTYWTANDATNSRTINVTGGQPNVPFSFDNSVFDMMKINQKVSLNTVEQWTITNNNIFGHAFHIHDVQFKIVSRSSGKVEDYESGWKDVLYLPISQSATFVTKFEDYADSTHPFMYHCHFGNHEDGGMMGQFLVIDSQTDVNDNSIISGNALEQNYPNPFSNISTIKYNVSTPDNVSIKLFDTFGNQIATIVDRYQEPGSYFFSINSEELNLSNGVYFYRLNTGNITETKAMIVAK